MMLNYLINLLYKNQVNFMKGIIWIKDLQDFQFQSHHHNGQQYSIAIYTLKHNHSARFMTYFFPLQDEIAGIQPIKSQLDIYQNIGSRYLAKISHAALLNQQQGHKLTLMHQISKAVTISNGEGNGFVGMIQDMMSVLKGINKLHSADLFHGLISQTNIFRKDKGVYLGLPLFNALSKTRKKVYEDNKSYQLNKKAFQKKDMELFANYLQAALKWFGNDKYKQQIPQKMHAHLQKLIQKIKHSDIELIQLYKQMKKMISTIRVQFDINYNLFLGDDEQNLLRSHLWEQVCTLYIQDHFEVAIKYNKEQIKLQVTSCKIPHFCFQRIINNANFRHQHIQSIQQLYYILISKSCRINIDSYGCINFTVNYDKRGLHQDVGKGKLKIEEVDLVQNLSNMVHSIGLLISNIKQYPQAVLRMNDLKQKIKEFQEKCYRD